MIMMMKKEVKMMEEMIVGEEVGRMQEEMIMMKEMEKISTLVIITITINKSFNEALESVKFDVIHTSKSTPF